MVENISLVISLVSLALILVTAYKVRKIHIAFFEQTEKIREIHRESLASYGQVQAYLDLTRLLDLDKPLPTLRGWAASPDFLLVIAQHALKHKPSTILECSSGASTVVMARCAQLNGNGHVYSLENDPKFAAITRQNLENAGLAEWATVIDAPLVQLAELPQHRWYSIDRLGDIGTVDMVVIDGPPESTCELARYPAIPLLQNRFANSCYVFMDDAARSAETLIIERWKQESTIGSVSVSHIPCEKGCAIVHFTRASLIT